MSNDLLDDPMDIGTPSQRSELGDSSKGSASASSKIEEREIIPGEVSKAPPVRYEDKRDKELYDEPYDLTVVEPAVDVEAIASMYTGRAFLVRGRFIAKHCPTLRADAYCALINYLKENTSDITHYLVFFNELEHTLANDKLTVSLPLPIRDYKWTDETNSTWQFSLDRLQSDYKKNKDEGVKESTRRAMEDLFAHFVDAGKVEEAIKLYSRGIRDYCTQLKHNINMWLNWVEVSIWANDWTRLESVINTAYRSLKDADEAEKNSQNQPPRGDNATFLIERDAAPNVPTLTNKMLVETALAKLLTARVLLKLRSGKYSQVVEDVFEIKTEHLPAKWFATTSDLGVYALLCAMATMERGKLKASVGGSGTFRKLLESEPLFIELLSCYTSSRFGRCFEIMFSVKNRLLLDPFMSRSVGELFNKIRQKCIVQYILPYSTVKMDSMCAALGTSMADLQHSLIDLMESKSVVLQIDQSAGVIRIVDQKDEGTTLKRVNETCDRAILRAKSLLWKSTLASANIHAIPDKEPRQKRKQQKDFGRHDRSTIDLEDDILTLSENRRASRGEGSSSNAVPMSDDFNIVFDQPAQPNYDDLGDI